MQLRLQKILAQGTDLSRRAAEEAISEGKVKVNGIVVTKLGSKADPAKDRISLSGKPVKMFTKKIYIAYYKPRNTIVSKSDPEDRPLIWDRLPKEMRELLNSAGRLDFDSEGLLILSNDGDLIYKLTHPSCKVWKKYFVKVSGIPSDEAIKELQDGVLLDDGMTEPAKVKMLKSTEKNAAIEISIREGRNRQIRRMCDKIGHSVMKLRRVEIGEIKVGNLKAGEWRYLTKKEEAFIRHLRVS